MNDLAIVVSGDVEEKSLVKFNKYEHRAFAVIKGMCINPKTTEEIEAARSDVKTCIVYETKMANLEQDIKHQNTAISNLLTRVNKVSNGARDARLPQNTAIKLHDAKKKADTIQCGLDAINEVLENSPVAFAFSVNSDAVCGAVKNKRSLENMEEAVQLVVVSELDRLTELEELFRINITAIETVEDKYKSLFPDRKTVALTPIDTVIQTIEARQNKFDLEEAQRKEAKRVADERDAKAKIEAEAKEKDRIAELKRYNDANMEVTSEKDPVLVEESFLPESDFIPPPPPADLPHEVPLPHRPKSVAVTVMVDRDSYDEVLRAITRIVGVVEVLL